jgi:hypothetical protein
MAAQPTPTDKTLQPWVSLLLAVVLVADILVSLALVAALVAVVEHRVVAQGMCLLRLVLAHLDKVMLVALPTFLAAAVAAVVLVVLAARQSQLDLTTGQTATVVLVLAILCGQALSNATQVVVVAQLLAVWAAVAPLMVAVLEVAGMALAELQTLVAVAAVVDVLCAMVLVRLVALALSLSATGLHNFHQRAT